MIKTKTFMNKHAWEIALVLTMSLIGASLTYAVQDTSTVNQGLRLAFREATEIEDPSSRTAAFWSIADVQVKAGDRKSAGKSFRKARQASHGIKEDRGSMLSTLVSVQAINGFVDEALMT